MSSCFRRLYAEALETPFIGWDFSYLASRTTEQNPPWDYGQLAVDALRNAETALDMGTGGGEWLAGLGRRPPFMWATEGYSPNIPLARRRLSVLDVCLTTVSNDQYLPLPANSFDVILNRHQSYDVGEVSRILRPNGMFVTQQVGSLDMRELNALLGDDSRDQAVWDAVFAVSELEAEGFSIQWCEESFLPFYFHDISAVVYYLKAIPWQIPYFSLVDPTNVAKLEDLHRILCADGRWRTHQHRFAIIAQKTSASAYGGV